MKLIGTETLHVYEKVALAQWLTHTKKDPSSGKTVTSMEDYMDATADVRAWLEAHLHLPEGIAGCWVKWQATYPRSSRLLLKVPPNTKSGA